MFKLNRIGMDITVVYLFILLLLVSAPSLVNQLTSSDSAGTVMSLPFFLIYFFIFSYLPLTIAVFIYISLLSYAGTGIAKLLRRKIRFSILWKLNAYTTTIPFILYSIIAFFFSITDAFLVLFILYSFIFMFKMITVYPKRKKRP
ncbi:DUF1189 family protein [Lentibacillus persicus]|nr:DUF1189 family protein [Lentibacillus persicus]